MRSSTAWVSLEEVRVRADGRAALQLVDIVEGDVNGLAGPEKATAVRRTATVQVVWRDVGRSAIAA
jgi:hypothetical protein